MRQFENQIVLITGGANGIGRATAETNVSRHRRPSRAGSATRTPLPERLTLQ
jgi:NAD(P)-dependent dehydrogenase (short-subunit alcohol dehydrogenase family)